MEDFPGPGGRIPPLRRFKNVGGHYAETMGNTDAWPARIRCDGPTATNAPPSVVVRENFPRGSWKEPAAALGRRIRESVSGQWRTIVGVVGNSATMASRSRRPRSCTGRC